MITALIAAFGVTDNEQLALQIAFVHLLFNLGAMLIIFGWPTLRKIPLRGSAWLSHVASRRRSLAFLWIFVVFFLLPGSAGHHAKPQSKQRNLN